MTPKRKAKLGSQGHDGYVYRAGTGYVPLGTPLATHRLCGACARLATVMRAAADELHDSFGRPASEVNAAAAQARRRLMAELRKLERGWEAERRVQS